MKEFLYASDVTSAPSSAVANAAERQVLNRVRFTAGELTYLFDPDAAALLVGGPHHGQSLHSGR